MAPVVFMITAAILVTAYIIAIAKENEMHQAVVCGLAALLAAYAISATELSVYITAFSKVVLALSAFVSLLSALQFAYKAGTKANVEQALPLPLEPIE